METPTRAKNHDAQLAFSAYFPADNILKWCSDGYWTHFVDILDRLQ
jgi:hypothetical protein